MMSGPLELKHGRIDLSLPRFASVSYHHHPFCTSYSCLTRHQNPQVVCPPSQRTNRTQGHPRGLLLLKVGGEREVSLARSGSITS